MKNFLLYLLAALMLIGFGSCSSDDKSADNLQGSEIPAPKPDPVPDPGPEPEPGPEPGPDPEPETDPEPGPDPGPEPEPEPDLPSWYQPAVMSTWQWQLQGTINTSYNVDIYDIDLFDTSMQQIAELHSQNKKVICYFSAGTYEDWRDDASQFTSSDLGNPLDEWEGERWIDVRSENVRNIMKERLILAQNKGCDGVEPDNVDGYTNNPGLDFSAVDQLDYNIWMASEAHRQALSIGLKNDLDQVNDLVSHYDFAVNEQCFQYNECTVLSPFIDAGKPVFNAEYKKIYREDPDARDELCLDANNMQFSTLILRLALDDSYRDSCL